MPVLLRSVLGDSGIVPYLIWQNTFNVSTFFQLLRNTKLDYLNFYLTQEDFFILISQFQVIQLSNYLIGNAKSKILIRFFKFKWILFSKEIYASSFPLKLTRIFFSETLKTFNDKVTYDIWYKNKIFKRWCLNFAKNLSKLR